MVRLVFDAPFAGVLPTKADENIFALVLTGKFNADSAVLLRGSIVADLTFREARRATAVLAMVVNCDPAACVVHRRQTLCPHDPHQVACPVAPSLAKGNASDAGAAHVDTRAANDGSAHSVSAGVVGIVSAAVVFIAALLLLVWRQRIPLQAGPAKQPRWREQAADARIHHAERGVGNQAAHTYAFANPVYDTTGATQTSLAGTAGAHGGEDLYFDFSAACVTGANDDARPAADAAEAECFGFGDVDHEAWSESDDTDPDDVDLDNGQLRAAVGNRAAGNAVDQLPWGSPQASKLAPSDRGGEELYDEVVSNGVQDGGCDLVYDLSHPDATGFGAAAPPASGHGFYDRDHPDADKYAVAVPSDAASAGMSKAHKRVAAAEKRAAKAAERRALKEQREDAKRSAKLAKKAAQVAKQQERKKGRQRGRNAVLQEFANVDAALGGAFGAVAVETPGIGWEDGYMDVDAGMMEGAFLKADVDADGTLPHGVRFGEFGDEGGAMEGPFLDAEAYLGVDDTPSHGAAGQGDASAEADGFGFGAFSDGEWSDSLVAKY